VFSWSEAEVLLRKHKPIALPTRRKRIGDGLELPIPERRKKGAEQANKNRCFILSTREKRSRLRKPGAVV